MTDKGRRAKEKERLISVILAKSQAMFPLTVGTMKIKRTLREHRPSRMLATETSHGDLAIHHNKQLKANHRQDNMINQSANLLNQESAHRGDSCNLWHPGLCKEYKKQNCLLGDGCVFQNGNGNNNNNNRQNATPPHTPRKRRCGHNPYQMGSMMPAVEVSTAPAPQTQKVEIEVKVKGE